MSARVTIVAFLILVLGVGVTAQESAVSPERTEIRRTGPQTATQGVDVAEYFERQATLHTWLLSELPAATMSDTVTVQMTEADLAPLSEPVDLREVPKRVGIVKQLDRPIHLSCKSVGNRQVSAQCEGGGSIELTEDGGFVWSRSFTSVDAVSIRLHVTDLSLPADADLYFMSEDGEAYGPFQGTGPNDNGDLWLPSVKSDTGIVVVRHFGPEGLADLGALSMTFSEIAHIVEDVIEDDTTPAGDDDLCPYNASCVQNASCQSSGPATTAESAAAKMRWIAGCCVNICSGGLIADTDNSSEIPYFLTANHCLSNNNAASNLEAFFQYTMNCGGSCPAGSFNPAPVTTKTLGASVMASSRDGDFTLLQLDEAPPAGSVYLGWNNAPIANSNGAALHRIHHPSGAPQAYTEHAVDANIGTCRGAPRGEYIYSDDVFGATEGGSSGSPVVNSSGEIVGQLLGCCPLGGGNCSDVCNSNNHTVDGALAFYFPSVAQFLDPSPCTPTTASCSDGIDNDCDGVADCDDTNGGAEDCSSEPTCETGCVNPGGAPAGASCSGDGDCCSNKCKGSPNNKTCR